jgi:hypothetical protein
MIPERYRTDYTGEFVILETKWSGGKKTQTREWVANPIENHHISGRAACIGSGVDRASFDYTHLQRHRGGLLGSKKLQTYGVGAIAADMRCDFIIETNNDNLNRIADTKYQENNIVYTTPRLCILHPGEFYLIPYIQKMVDMAQLLYLAAFDGHKEVFMLGYTNDALVNNSSWMSDIKSVIASYPGVKFYIISDVNNIPEEWLNLPNVTKLKYREFITYCDV